MALDNIANIAEIVGVILVIVTLVFLTLQIRQQTKAMKATTIQEVMQTELSMMSILADNAAIWEKIIVGAPLEPGEEMRKAIIIFNMYMIDTEHRYHQYNTGFLDTQAWEGRLGTLPFVVTLPAFELWRASHGGQSHAADFLALLDKLRNEAANG